MPQRHIQQGIRKPTDWEKILANHLSDKRLIFRIDSELLKLMNNKGTTLFVTGQGLEQTSLQRRHTNSQQA
jgi:hypothetical protein